MPYLLQPRAYMSSPEAETGWGGNLRASLLTSLPPLIGGYFGGPVGAGLGVAMGNVLGGMTGPSAPSGTAAGLRGGTFGAAMMYDRPQVGGYGSELRKLYEDLAEVLRQRPRRQMSMPATASIQPPMNWNLQPFPGGF